MFSKQRIYLFILLSCLVTIFGLTVNIMSKHLPPNESVKADSSVQTKGTIKPQPYKSIALVAKAKKVKYQTSHDVQPLYLTFDDGPNEYTAKILAILNKKKIHATFFMLNGNIKKYQNVVSSLYKSGHSIGCHGVTHDVKKFYLSKRSPLLEMNTCKKTVLKASGDDTLLIRVPYGSYPNLKAAQKKYLDRAGFIMWDWNVDSEDWLRRNKTPTYLIHNIVEQVKVQKKHRITPVILMHDSNITVDSLPKLIDKLIAMGYTLKPIVESLEPLQFHLKR
ncbi:polysaccharide deacetylase family protein [Cytobacillus sp. Hz8]|uniref:polysaccharide deacetylase family protein n=1 Tax=Cytobacillus sp. Hz8 TaxID=3347168 RepID=UPI0035DC0FF4